MISVDTNILLYSLNAHCDEHAGARRFMEELADRRDVIICELVLVELYMLLRHPTVVARPLGAADAVRVCNRYRQHPHWRLAESAPVMGGVWRRAGVDGIARRRIIDTRLGLTLIAHGVRHFATRNTKDFGDLGFERVFDPLTTGS